MLSTTFLGHQGWLFQSKTSCLLVDPLLCEEFGYAHALEYRVYPPRVFTFDAFPKIDGVALTHEHDDHFDIPSLARLERTIPIFLSSRSSAAARQILTEMGFTVHPLTPGQSARFGDLELTPFCGEHITANNNDEWDTLPFFVRDTGGSGNFFSMVDITLSEQHLKWARAKDSRPVVITWTNNLLDWSHMADFVDEHENGTQESLVKMGVDRKVIIESWGTPAAMLICAGGFTFYGDRSWLNQRAFCVDSPGVCQMMSKLYPKEQFHAARPGQTFWMEGHRLKRVLDDTPYLRTTPPETWPSRAKAGVREVPDYAPATGRREMESGDYALLEQRLQEFAGALVGGTIFRGLHSLLASDAQGRIPTFAIVTRDGRSDDRQVYEYVPAECAFTKGAVKAKDTYLAGMECWATDLLAVLGGDLGPIALNFGRARLWNASPGRFVFDVFGELNRFSHPLRRPAEYLRTYQRLLAKCGNVEPTIFRN
jgi:hypothetical protein